MSRTRAGVVVAAAATVLFAAIVTVRPGGDTVTRWLDDCGTVAAAGTAALLCARATWAGGALRRFWGLLTVATSCWTAGEIGWAAYDLPTGSVPTASWADVAYLAALPPVAAALLSHPSFRGRSLRRARSVVDGLVVTAALFLVAWLAVSSRASVLSTGGLVTLAYPCSDVVLLVLVVLVVRGTTTGERRDLWWLLGGLLLMATSDSAYAYVSQVHDFATGNAVDTGWVAAYLAIAVAAAVSAPASATALEARHALTPAALVTPFAVVLGALVVLTARLQLSSSLDGVSLATGMTLIALVLLRQALLVLDLVRAAGTAGSLQARLRTALGDAP